MVAVTLTWKLRAWLGKIGEGIASGKGKKIVWQVAVDISDLYGTNFVFEVVADDNVGPTAINAGSVRVLLDQAFDA